MLSTSAAVVLALGSNVIVALCSIRLTDASCTPLCPASIFCTNDWHAAHVIPVTGIVTRSSEAGDEAVVFTTASSIFKIFDIAPSPNQIVRLLRNLRREADAVHRSGNLFRRCFPG